MWQVFSRSTWCDLDLFRPAGRYCAAVRTVLVLSHGAMPSTDLYLAARLVGMATRYVDTSLSKPDPEVIHEGCFVIIVRYAPRSWLRLLYKHREHLGGAVLLLDDDIPGALACPDLPWLYALKTAYRYLSTRRLMGEVCDAVWVSTPFLQEKYRDVQPRLLSPLYLGAPLQSESDAVTYFYHGTSSHRVEITFLVEVVKLVQARMPHAHFEIIGSAGVRRLFRGIPRVSVLHPMIWPDFLAYTSRVRHDLGLAPMLDTRFNRARSHVKLFDITRCGASGIYSDTTVYRDNVPAGCGVLCPNDVLIWADEICRLLADSEARASTYRNALTWCEAHADDREFSLSDAHDDEVDQA
jgi:glycosyltransferase involved in cell wall biosynthesis